MTEPTPPYTAAEVAALCRVSAWTVGNWVRTGKLPKLPGRLIRIPAPAVHAMLEEGYHAVDVQSDRPAQAKAPTPRRRDRVQADGQMAASALGGGSALDRRVGPAAGDVVVSYVSRGSR